MTNERNVFKRPLSDFLQTPEKRARDEQTASRQPFRSPSSAGETQAPMDQDVIVCIPCFLLHSSDRQCAALLYIRFDLGVLLELEIANILK